MITIDTSVIIAMSLNEPEAETFHSLVTHGDILIGWPTLLEARMVLAGRKFPNASAIIKQLSELPNVTAVAFGERHYFVAEKAFDQFGKGRHPASLNMGDCFSYAVSVIANAPLLFKGRDFSQTDLKLHPASSTA
ncbi:PIN domain-containing protein [Agrobacterium vitis]|uniref:type II toxin-antitoxin system VapC family toxin n=1 Tax=Rhizobium/Agrobacterium group TaxID=227290 RepID=UPI0008DC05DE|nr:MULTISPECIES: type II toxin-antitoxin system VapC family toxin [Rhizobium/Agrobacterium group]MCF1436702.1 type II toxin-antitoxin system VapC family toxin [Allorhizobium ampelinum]MUO92267.1 PIN domain-containing protein [Agrobacterium vitis]MUZ55424.1 PIN domain-containing protein [Agrobacterium vitis]MUZ94689.1 PIN domain-containing protein [Agrobacterium vitis]MVA43026.1 PIN domain-containing protein [Agrobacterium vitis]